MIVEWDAIRIAVGQNWLNVIVYAMDRKVYQKDHQINLFRRHLSRTLAQQRSTGDGERCSLTSSFPVHGVNLRLFR